MTRVRAAGILAFCLTASTAGAQETTPRVTLVPSNATRWDASAHLTWLGERRTDPSFEWDNWFGVASGGATVGYHWTPHLKTELDLTTSSEGETYSVEIIPVPGLTNPLFIQRDHEIRFTTASAGLTGQFFENAWFHPFVGAGIELVREREHIEIVPLPVAPGDPRASLGVPLEDETRVRYSGRPYVATGFKVYFSDHAFFRTDVRTSWSRDGLAALGWRSGVGVDF
jgi:hypothetical protein